MKKLLLFLSGIIIFTWVKAADITQSSQGDNSPTITTSSGNVNITYANKEKDNELPSIILSNVEYQELDAYPVIDEIYTGGVNISFFLSHSKKGSSEAIIKEIGIKLISFNPDTNSNLSYTEDIGTIPGKGTVMPNIFTTKIGEDGVVSTKWVMSDGIVVKTKKKGDSISSFEDLRSIVLSGESGDIEKFVGYILPVDTGTYEVEPYIIYSINNNIAELNLPKVRIYYE